MRALVKHHRAPSCLEARPLQCFQYEVPLVAGLHALVYNITQQTRKLSAFVNVPACCAERKSAVEYIHPSRSLPVIFDSRDQLAIFHRSTIGALP